MNSALATDKHRELMVCIHASVGRNLIRGQSLEVGLKTLLPFINIGDAPHCLHGLGERHAQLAKTTLGQLVKSFYEVAKCEDGSLQALIERVLNDRNNLVHHFHETLGRDALTRDGCNRIIAALDDQFEAIKLVEEIVTEILQQLLRAIRDITFQGTPDYEDIASLCAEYEAALRSKGIRNTSASEG